MPQDTTYDGLLNKRVMVEQPAKGFRIAIDTVLMAAAVPAKAGDYVLDMGCGVGGAMLCLALRVPDVRVDGIDIQQELTTLCHRNIERNNFSDRLRVFTADAPSHTPEKLYTHIMINPPYHDAAQHVGSDNPQKQRAHMMEKDAMQAWLTAADKMLYDTGTITIIHRADRADGLIATLSHLRPQIEILPLLPKADLPPKRIVLRTTKGAAQIRTCKPLILHQSDGKFTKEADAVLRDVGPIHFG